MQFKTGKTTAKQVEDAKREYREAIIEHRKVGFGTLADGEHLNYLKSLAYTLMEAYRLGV